MNLIVLLSIATIWLKKIIFLSRVCNLPKAFCVLSIYLLQKDLRKIGNNRFLSERRKKQNTLGSSGPIYQKCYSLMRKAVTHSPMSTSEKFLTKLMEIGTAVSTKTIQRRSSLEFGLKSCKPARKPSLTQAMKKKRLDFVKRHAGWDIDIEIGTFHFNIS